MRFMKLVSRPLAITTSIVLGMVAVLAVVSSAVAPTQTFAADKVEQKDKVAPKEKTERGRFVSFKDGTLTIKVNSGALIGTKISDNTKTVVWNNDEGKYLPTETAEALKLVKAEAWFQVLVANENVTLRIGAKKSQVTGTFVSFKNERMLMLGKDLGPSYTKKYGNNLHFNKFRDDVPVHESIDGGEYKLIGTANKVLVDIKEGTILTVHGEGDDNITLIQIGVPKKE